MTTYYICPVYDGYFEMNSGYDPKGWRKAATLKEALRMARDIVSKDDEAEVKIQTSQRVRPYGPRIPQYLVGTVYHPDRGVYIFAKYVKRSFNENNYSEDYLLNKDGSLKGRI